MHELCQRDKGERVERGEGGTWLSLFGATHRSLAQAYQMQNKNVTREKKEKNKRERKKNLFRLGTSLAGYAKICKGSESGTGTGGGTGKWKWNWEQSGSINKNK